MTNKPNNMLTLFLMTEKGYRFLQETVDKYASLFSLIVVGNDTSIREDFENEIIDFCVQHNLRCVKKLDFEKIESEYALAVSWRWLIKHPEDKLIVFHDSLLPKYRGFAPLVNSLINGETEIGVSAIFGGTDFDTGRVIAQSKTTITYPIKIADAIQVINKNYLACAEVVLNTLLNEKQFSAIPQDESAASYSIWRDEQDYKIDWSKSATEIRRFIDAVGYPYQGASTLFDDKLVRILGAEEVPDVKVDRHHGKVLFIKKGRPIVICGRGMLMITEAHIEDKGNILPFFPLSKFRIRFT